MRNMYYEWFDPHAVRAAASELDEKLWHKERDYEDLRNYHERVKAHLEGRVQGMEAFATKIASAMPIGPLFVPTRSVSQ